MFKNAKRIRFTHLLIAFLMGALVYWIFSNIINNQKKLVTIRINGEKYHLEIADSSLERGKGLMNRDSLEPKHGMLFIFPKEGKHSFWMYQTYIPLDMIWLDKNWQVVDIKRNVPPCKSKNPAYCPSYRPSKKAKYIIEIPAKSY